MPQYLSPGVYVEELERGDLPPDASGPPVTGVSSRSVWMAEHSVAAFIGRAEAGPVGAAVEVRSENEFAEAFGRSPWGACIAGFFANGGRVCRVLRADSCGLDDFADAVQVLERVPDVSIVAAPDLMVALREGLIDLDAVRALQLTMINHCEPMGDRVTLLDPPGGLSAPQVRDWRVASDYDSAYAAMFWPWVSVDVDGRRTVTAPSGHVAGLLARLDGEVGPHRSPLHERLSGVHGVETGIKPFELDVLNPMGINGLAAESADGALVRGMRTLTARHPQWRLLPVRRVMALISRNLRTRTTWALSARAEDPGVWSQLQHDVTALLCVLWQGQAFLGSSQDDAFWVRCDRDTNRAQASGLPIITMTGAVRLDAASVGFNVRWGCH